MTRLCTTIAGLVLGFCLSACGGGSSDTGGSGPPPTALQFIAPNDNAFAAAVDPSHPSTVYGPTTASYAGVRKIITATLAVGSPTTHNQTDYAQIYKAGDGHLYRVDLVTIGTPVARQVSSESHATIDDRCSLNGANTVFGTDVNYVAVQSYVDYQNPENSAYFYRVPGPNGTCGTAEDIVYMTKLGMTATDPPIQALMPVAVVHDVTTGALSGFIVNEGTTLSFYDQNFQHRTVMLTATASIGVAYGLASSGVNASGGLLILDGSIVYVDYAQKSVSSSLFNVPNWDPGRRIVNSANGNTVYFAVNTSNLTVKPVLPTSAIYSMPLDGSATPTALATESGVVGQISVATYGTTPAWSLVPPGGQYTIRTLAPGGQVVTAFTAAANFGTFLVTANDIYYTVSTLTFPVAHTVTFANTQTGVIGMDGTVVLAPLINSRFVAQERDSSGSNWLKIIRARNLTPVTLTNTVNGNTYTEDGISGATLEVLDTATHSITVTLGTLPASTAMQGTGVLIGTAGYIDGVNVNSTANPTTRDLIYFDTTQANSLFAVTNNLH